MSTHGGDGWERNGDIRATRANLDVYVNFETSEQDNSSKTKQNIKQAYESVAKNFQSMYQFTK